jgi:LacI family transcriptional regulator
MKKRDIPTLEDVALSSNVSTATVSRYLNNPEKVAKSTHSKIQRAIQKLGYTPNLGGRMLASNKVRMVGAIIPTMANAIFSNGIQAFQEELSKNDITLLIASSGYDPDQELQQMQSLLASGAGGLLLIGDERPKKTLKFLDQRNLPYVVAWAFKEEAEGNYAGFNNRQAAYDLAKIVIEYGHTKLAMIAGISENNDRAGGRIEGVKEAIAEHSGSVRLVDLIETKYRMETGGNAFDALMSRIDKPSVIMCGNDVLAAGVIMRARQRGIRVPEDVSVTGFDDLNIASALTPSLTTVRVPHFAMGKSCRQIAPKTHTKG